MQNSKQNFSNKSVQFIESIVQMPLMSLPVRSVLFDFEQEKVLISPGSQISDEQYKVLSDITDIVAPNLFHAGGVQRALQFFPKARVWGVDGCQKLKPEINWTHQLGKDPWPHVELVPYFLDGMPKVNEWVFWHPKTHSLIVADLIFNLQKSTGLGAWIILNMFGTYNKLGVSRFFKKFMTEPEKTRDSLKALLELEIKCLVPSHGEIVSERGQEVLSAALRRAHVI